MKNSLTILIHGFNKDSRDMAFLEKGLSESGFETVSVDLPARLGTMDKCIEVLHLQISDLVREHQAVNYVAHSMGGLIARAYINHVQQANVGKCVFIATPHNGSRLAGIANRIPFYSMIFQTVKPILPGSDFLPPSLPEGIMVGLIAGNKNRHLLGRLFLSEQSDGRIEVSSVESRDADEFIVLPFGHKEIHHQHETLMLVRNFLLKGTFVNS
ncbi:MAG: alpha/beta fold hydrolase [Acidobacteriota bacterium]